MIEDYDDVEAYDICEEEEDVVDMIEVEKSTKFTWDVDLITDRAQSIGEAAFEIDLEEDIESSWYAIKDQDIAWLLLTICRLAGCISSMEDENTIVDNTDVV